MKITDVEIVDIRFPTSKTLDGSDAMNEAPDYSCAYVTIRTDSGISGYGLSFTIGRGTEIVVLAIQALKHQLIGKNLSEITGDMAAFWRNITGDSQLRWIGPEAGAIHLATSAIVNATWDLWARAEGKPLWRLIADLSPKEFVKCIDFRYITDFLTADEAVDILERAEAGKPERIEYLEKFGLPAYTTSAGWLGYDDEKLRRLCVEGVKEGWNTFKLKVGVDIEEDLRRGSIMREVIGFDRRFMIDANQVWEVEEAIMKTKRLADLKPWFVEEPVSPHDILGHARIRKELEPMGIGVATGEHGMNRVIFKQLLQSDAITVCQPDACRLGGVNEVLSVLLMSSKKGVPVCPHGGGVGLCEHIQHLSAIDYICITGDLSNRVVEYVDHLHQHFEDPVKIVNSCYSLPQKPGYSTKMFDDSIRAFRFAGEYV